MARSIGRYSGIRGKLTVLVLGTVLTLLFAAACGATTKAATIEPTSTPEASGGGSETAPVESPEPGVNQPGKVGGSTTPVTSGTGFEPAPLPSEGLTGEPRTESTSSGAVGSQASPAVQYTANQQAGIWVTGVGEVTATPDLAILSAGVEATAKTVGEALNQAAQAMDQMMQVLTDRGVTAEDIKTRFFNISPEYVWNRLRERQELVGYRVSNQITVKIRDLGSAGVIIDELASAGGDLARIQGISFTVEDTKPLEVEAREKAVASLLEKAQQYADLTGVQLGKIIYLSESGGFTPVINNFGDGAFREMAAAAIATPISGGESTIRVMVQGVFAIE